MHKNRQGGRPKLPANEKRSYAIKVNYDRLNYHKIKLRSRTTGKSMSEIVYEMSVNGYVKTPLSESDIEHLRKLAGMANNLNQLTKLGHSYGFPQIATQNQKLAQEISELIIKLNELI